MRIINLYIKFLTMACIAVIITSCSGGSCAPSAAAPFSSYTFNNGSSLTGTGVIKTMQGSTPSSTFTLSGGTNLPFGLQLTAVPSNSPQNAQLQTVNNNNLSGEFSPSTLVVISPGGESTSTLNVVVPQNLPVGTYYLNLYANPLDGNPYVSKNQYLGYIKIVVTANDSPTPVGPPTIATVSPINETTNASLSTSISITFSQAMDTNTLNGSNILLQQDGTNNYVALIDPTYSIDNKTVTFIESNLLLTSTKYNVKIPTPANIKSQTSQELTLDSTTYPNNNVTTFTTGNPTSICGGQNSWVLNQTNNSMTTCDLYTDGSLQNCSGNGTAVTNFSTPNAIIAPYSGAYGIYTVNGGNNLLLSYFGAWNTPVSNPNITSPYSGASIVVANNVSSIVFVNSDHTLTICGYNSGTFGITTCSVATVSGVSSDAFGSGYSDGYFWITNKNSNSISSCPTSSGITSCSNAGGNGFHQPTSIYATTTYALITNSGNNTVSLCDVSNGSLSNCRVTGSNFIQPSSIYGLKYEPYIFVTNKSDNSVTSCLNTNGTLSNCNRMQYGFTSPVSFAGNETCG